MARTVLGPNQPPVQWVPVLFPRVKSGRGVTLTPHPLLVPWSWKARAISLHPLWAVRSVQSLSACRRVHFILLLVNTLINWVVATAPYTSIGFLRVKEPVRLFSESCYRIQFVPLSLRMVLPLRYDRNCIT